MAERIQETWERLHWRRTELLERRTAQGVRCSFNKRGQVLTRQPEFDRDD